jgi:hypothetical protein
MNDLNVGDRVVLIEADPCSETPVGTKGTITNSPSYLSTESYYPTDVDVSFDNDDDQMISPQYLRRIVGEAEALARVTGSVSVTIIHERRLPSGELVVESVERYDRREA